MPVAKSSITQTVRDSVREVLSEIQRLRSQPVGDPPSRAGAARLEDILGGRDRQGSFVPAVVAEWGQRAIRGLAPTSGDTQVAVTGEAVPADLTVRVTNVTGDPIPDVDVRFVVSGGDGELTQHTATTANGGGNAGVATLRKGAWILGPNGENRLTAVAGNLSVVFTARAATRLTPTSATDQTAQAGKQVRDSPTVRVSDSAGGPVPGIPVMFQVSAGGGTVSKQSVPTDLKGIASAGNWNLGNVAGTNIVVASTGSLSTEFRAEGT